MMRRSISSSVWALVLLTIVGCAVAAYPDIGQGKTILTVMDWKLNETEGTKKWFQFVKQKFESEHPGVEIKYQTAPWGDEYRQKVILGVASGTGPDVVALSIIWARELFEQGAIIPLNKFIEKTPEVAPDKMYPATQQYNQKDGKIFGITNAADFSCILYDIDAFEEAGLNADPYAISNWDQFALVAQKLMKVKSDKTVQRYGFSQGLWHENYNSWLVANGGSFYNKDHTKAGFNTRAGIQAAEFLDKIYNVYKVVGGVFQEGTAAMGYGLNVTPYFIADTNPKLRFNMTSFPPGPSSTKRGCVLWGNMSSITKTCKHPELAWDFIKYYTSLQGDLDKFKFLPSVQSPRLDFYESSPWKAMEARYRWAAMYPKIAAVGGVYAYIRHAEMVPKVWDALLYPAIMGQKPIESSFAEAERIYNTILAK